MTVRLHLFGEFFISYVITAYSQLVLFEMLGQCD